MEEYDAVYVLTNGVSETDYQLELSQRYWQQCGRELTKNSRQQIIQITWKCLFMCSGLKEIKLLHINVFIEYYPGKQMHEMFLNISNLYIVGWI